MGRPPVVAFLLAASVLLAACAAASQPGYFIVGAAADFANDSVTAISLPATFEDPDPPAIGSETPGVVTQPATANISPVRAYLVRDSAGAFEAIYARDPFRGCTITWVGTDGQFADPCHGSRYSQAGARLSGPSPRDLDQFGVAVTEDGQVVVDLQQFKMGVERP